MNFPYRCLQVAALYDLTIGLLFCVQFNLAHADVGPSEPVQPTASLVKEVKIGVMALRGADKTIVLWEPTADYLSQSIDGYHFSIAPLNNDSMADAVVNNQVDFVLSNPASYATLEKEFGVTRLVTLKNRRIGGAYTQFGALIFTRSDRNDINSLDDLRNKSFMAVHPSAFGGWWMALRTFKQHGIDPEKEFSKIEYSGFPQDKIVYAVKQGKIDAGTVRTDLLETMQKEGKIDLKEFKVLNPQPQSEEFPFVHSTDLYPEWAFAKTRQVSGNLARNVTIALLNLPADHLAATTAKSAGWTVPLDYQPVHDLMMELNVGPYEHLGEFNLADVVRKYVMWFVALGLLAFCLLVFNIIVARLNRQLSQSKQTLETSKTKLEQEVAERKLAEQAEFAQAQRIRALYEISAMPGLSFDEQIERTIKLGCRMFNLEIGKLCRVNRPQNINELVKVVAPDYMPIRSGMQLELPNTFCDLTFDRDDPLAINHVGSSEYKDHASYKFTGLEAYIGTPIWINGEKYGTINFSSRNPTQPFTEADKDIINLIGRWVSVAFERHYATNEIRLAREEAELANRAKSTFLASMSHELRTPLNAVIGYSELLQEELQDIGNNALTNDASKINCAGRNLLALINNVLDLSKIEAGKIDLCIENFNPRHILNDIEATIAPLAQKANNRLTIHIESDVEAIETDPGKLQQILINLLGNACKFTHNGEITLITRLVKIDNVEWIYFQVSDNGKGIAKSDAENLFSEFSQAGGAADKAKGTGLGLAISRKLCRLLGGDISFKSALSVGSTFTVALPKRRSDISSQQKGAEDAA